MAKAPAKKDVATKGNGALVAGQVDDSMLMEDADSGGHGFSREDLTLPFIRILQKLSPQLDKNEPNYIPGAEEGDFVNTATMESYSGEKGFYFCPAVYTINFTEWHPRESGGGMVSDHGGNRDCLQNTRRDEKGRTVTGQGTVIITSGLYFGFVIDIETGDYEQAILAFASTQLKKSRQLNAKIQSYRHTVESADGPRRINPRMWFHLLKLTTIPESNDQGKWMGYKVERAGSILEHDWGHQLYVEAKELADMFERGEVKMRAQDMEQDGDTQSSGGGSGAGNNQPQDNDEEIPF